MPVSAAISGLGSLGGAALGAWGSQNAASTMAGYGQQALASLQGILGPILGQGKSIVNTALGPLAKLLTPGASQTATLSQMPGFKFAQDWGQQAVKNLGTTQGLGGNVLTAGANYATGVAQQGYGQIVNQLQTLLGTGTSLEAGVGNALAQGTASTLTGIGQAKAAGQLGTANALSTGLQGASGSAGNYFGLQSLLQRFTPQGQSASIYGAQQPYTPLATDAVG